MTKPTYEQKQAFLTDILDICKKHQLYLRHCHVEYDDYDEDNFFEIVHLTDEYDLFEIQTAH